VLVDWICAAIFGAYLASFTALAVYRVPQGLSVWRPGSFCPACRRPLAVWETVPVVSWLLLRGRCRTCQAAIPVRDWIWELLGAGVAVGAPLVWGWTPTALLMACFWFGWLAIALLDWTTHTVPLAVIGALALLWGLGWWDHVAGGWVVLPLDPLQGVLVMAAVTALALLATRGRYGLGDGLLALIMGLYLGATWALLAWLAANVFVLPWLWRARRGTEIPFAPGLAAASVLCSLPWVQLTWLHWFPYVLPF
jgi:leader peptidase (prepilin peptidase)/N-methyltransferase